VLVGFQFEWLDFRPPLAERVVFLQRELGVESQTRIERAVEV
jgi:hypothetical protein